MVRALELDGRVSELSDLLTEVFGVAPSSPAESKLSASVEATAYWTFSSHLEVVLAGAQRLPPEGQAIAAWTKRLNKRAIPLVLIIESGEGQLVVGPSGKPPPAVRLDARLVVEDLASARELDPLDVRKRLPVAWQRARGAGGMTGLRNVGLFSTHYLRSRAPQLSDWERLAEQGGAARGARSLEARLKTLGFDSEERGAGVYLLRAENRPAAAVLSYPPNQDFDRAAAGGELPVAHLLREMEAAGTRWGILVSGDVWRLYSAEHPARTTSFAECDLVRLGDPAYFAVLFSAAALSPGGLAEAIEKGSRDFAVGLGDRLRGRVYDRVVPAIVSAIASELEEVGDPPDSRAKLEGVYEATLILLYRLLFVLYAEAREYLPVEVSAGYKGHSLRRRLDEIVATVEADRGFDESARDIWSDLEETFGAIARGQREWGVPPYNGGLFDDDPKTSAGSILGRVRPTNAGIGRALYELAVDSDDHDTGRIDYSDLDIRHLGDMYEGLLSFEVDRARVDLAYDGSKDAYVSAAEGEEVAIHAGAVYLRGRSGGRKASGSYYTPQIVVRHVVEEALVPVHDEHLLEVRRVVESGDEEKAARLLWDFRVCDPAMGSGHFLVDALDVLTDRVAAFLAERPLAPVRAVLNQLRETVQAQARDLPAGVLEQIRDVDLLKRVVLKRSIYGVDLNPMAVELAKLALWLDAFVPGLPLSYLDHNLRRGNSLVGVVGDEVLTSLRPETATLEGDWIAEQLAAAVHQSKLAVERVELRIEDVTAAREAEYERQATTTQLARIYDRWTAEGFGVPGARERIAQLDTLEAEADAREAGRIAEEQAFFHWPLELPEVFQRDRPGFDVVLANPPWDKLKVERHDFYQMMIPGLKFVSSGQERDALIAALPQEAHDRYEAEIRRIAGLKPYFAAGGGNYRLHGGGDPDLFKAFAERFMHLVRPRGAVGCVLPRQLLGGAGAKLLRQEFFTRWTIQSADVLWNRRVWAFPSVFHRTRMTLLAARREPPGPNAVVPSAGPLDDAERFARARELRVSYPLADLAAWSPSLELPSLPDPASGELFQAMMRHPRFDDDGRAWRAVPHRELDATADRDLYNEDGFGWPVWKGRTFERYQPDFAAPILWAEPDAALERISAAYRDCPKDCRVVFRDIVRATDRRTMRACLAPPHTFAIHDAPQLVLERGDERDVLRLLGGFNSLSFDWLVRRRVETHVTFGILNSLPIPDIPDGVAELAGRLSCVDERYADFAERAGIEWGPLSPEERGEFEAEIDALVAHAYGLTREQLEVIFTDFVEAAVPETYRDRVRAYYEALAVPA
jgi:hypothetical protein